MTEKRIVNEAYTKGATENPGQNTKISALDVKTNENGLELIAGEDAIKKLMELGVEVKSDGSLSIKATDNEIRRDGAEISERRKQGDRILTQEDNGQEK